MPSWFLDGSCGPLRDACKNSKPGTRGARRGSWCGCRRKFSPGSCSYCQTCNSHTRGGGPDGKKGLTIGPRAAIVGARRRCCRGGRVPAHSTSSRKARAHYGCHSRELCSARSKATPEQKRLGSELDDTLASSWQQHAKHIASTCRRAPS